MKRFYPTYLYIKTHNTTGLKYFGKTTKDPFKYRGSGKYWLAHIRKYGNDVTTEILGYFKNELECTTTALNFSHDNRIVESAEWANIINENGIDGGAIPREYNSTSNETKKKISTALTGRLAWNKGLSNVTPGNTTPRTDVQKLKISNSLKGRRRSAESILKTANALRGRKRPEVSKKLQGRKRSAETIQKMKLAQQNKGPLSESTKEKIRQARKLQVFSDKTKEKLKSKIVCINPEGAISKIDKEIFYSQIGTNETKTWVFHNSVEGKKRKMKR